MRIIVPGSAVLTLVLTLALRASGSPNSGRDEYYPTEETAELSSIIWPRLAKLQAGRALLEWPNGTTRMLGVGDRYRGLELVAVLPQQPALAVLEQDFPHWGILAYIGTNGPVATMRKAIGVLGNLPSAKAFPPQYFDRLLKAQEDVLGQEILAHGGDPTYEAVADLLPPLRAYTFLGTTTSAQKVIVWPDGRLGLGMHHRQLEHVLFDPAAVLRESAGSAAATKQGLVGAYLPVIDYAFSDARTPSGWEEIAFAAGREKLATYLCLRTSGGKRVYWRLPGRRPAEDGAPFYRALLSVQEEWQQFLAKGVQLEVPDPRVSDSSKAALVRALISEVRNHPKYGVAVYGAQEHDTFPPTTILLNLCLLDWGYTEEAKARLSYYLAHFVKPDGTFDYYGPAISEYGQLLTVAARYVRITGDTVWLQEYQPSLLRICNSLLAQISASWRQYPPDSPYCGLLRGSAEADTRKDKRFYFSGNVWCWRGLTEMGWLLKEAGERRGDAALAQFGKDLLGAGEKFRANVLAALRREFQKSSAPPFLPPIVGMKEPFGSMTENEFASYTNYRYWPEMLSPGMLPPEMRDAIIGYRTSHGGEVAGTTRLEDVMDDWPYAHYAWGLLEADQMEHYLLGFYGHLAYHQTPGSFTAYESVTIRGDSKRDYASDYCVPAQLVGPQLLRWMIAWEPWDKQELWLARAVPREWYAQGFSASRVPTCWGPVNLRVVPSGKGLEASVEIKSPHPDLKVKLRLRPDFSVKAPNIAVSGTKEWKWNAQQEAVELWGPWNRVTISVGY
jgi:hypothetical protein